MTDHIPSNLEDEIVRLKQRRNAVILAHYYQDEDIQDIADHVGDSLDLSRKAAQTQCEVIVFCGVRFMAETAKILSPTRTVLLPDINAGCSLEESCSASHLAAFRHRNPHHIVVSYINCSADVKALSDIIVTSSNAERIIRHLPVDKPILFAPDRHLGAWLQKQTGRDMTLWQGGCIVHETFSTRALLNLKRQYPQARVTAHPECEQSLLRHADHIGSTSAMLQFVTQSSYDCFIVATEKNLIHTMRKAAPHKKFIAAPVQEGSCDHCASCPYMALNTMEKLYLCLRDGTPAIDMESRLMDAALRPLQRMLHASRNENEGRMITLS